MIKLNASFSKKVPAEQEYSSKSFLASVEVELPSNANEQELRQKIHEIFTLVKQSVEDEINAQVTTQSSSNQQRPQERTEASVKASNKQIKYILDLGKAREKPLSDLNVEASHLYGVDSIYNLTKRDASRYVDVLKQAA